MKQMSYIATIMFCLTLHVMASENPLKINLNGAGSTTTPPPQTYSSANIYIQGNGMVDASNSLINGPVRVSMHGNGATLLNHKHDLDVEIHGNGAVYNLAQSLNLTTNIHGSGGVYENTWYPAWYLRNPLIGYIVVPVLVTLLVCKGIQFMRSTKK